MPAFDGGNDGVGIFGPGKWLWRLVVLGEVSIDGGLKVNDASEDAALEPTLCEDGEEALNGIEPGGRGRGEVEDETPMASEPLDHFGMLVSGIIVEDDMNGLAGGRLRLDAVEEANELLVTVALHALPDHRTVEHVERGEERGRSIAFIVMGEGPTASLLER